MDSAACFHGPAYPENLKQIEKLARLVNEQLKSKTFSCETWCTGKTENREQPQVASEPKRVVKEKKVETAAELVKRFEEYRWRSRETMPQSIYTWTNNYYLYYKQTILDQPFSIDQVKAVMDSYELGTRQRSLSYTRFKALAKFAQMDL